MKYYLNITLGDNQLVLSFSNINDARDNYNRYIDRHHCIISDEEGLVLYNSKP